MAGIEVFFFGVGFDSCAREGQREGFTKLIQVTALSASHARRIAIRKGLTSCTECLVGCRGHFLNNGNPINPETTTK